MFPNCKGDLKLCGYIIWKEMSWEKTTSSSDDNEHVFDRFARCNICESNKSGKLEYLKLAKLGL